MRIVAPLLCTLLVGLAATSTKAEEVDLLADGLAGWNAFLVDPNVKMEDVWSIEDGVLKCKGEPLGYLHTKEKFKDFKLTLEWKWTDKPGNSGVLLRIQSDPISFLPKCVEAQLMNGSAGDIWGFYGANVKGDADRTRTVKDHKALGNFGGVGKIKANEKKPGEWNKYEITMQGGKLTLVVNGEKVNEGAECDHVAGSIGLQSEGGAIAFRNIQITELKAE